MRNLTQVRRPRRRQARHALKTRYVLHRQRSVGFSERVARWGALDKVKIRENRQLSMWYRQLECRATAIKVKWRVRSGVNED